MSESMAPAAPGRPVLDYLPGGLFGSVMGLTGLSVAWHLAGARYGTPGWIATVIAALAVLTFAALLIGYGIKLATAPDAVRAEFRHPVRVGVPGRRPRGRRQRGRGAPALVRPAERVGRVGQP